MPEALREKRILQESQGGILVELIFQPVLKSI